ncbi:hypothetical protein ACEPAG_8986 [Sanghuangporus baumii]
MDSFPSEILSRILREAVPDPGESRDSNFHLRQCIETPLHISHVCRVWRDIAISDRKLWSCFSINTDFASIYKHAKVLFGIWLERSNGAALDYSLEFKFKKYQANHGLEEVSMDMIKMLVAQQHRWRSIEILWSPSREYVGKDLELYLTNMPKLTSLNLKIAQPIRFSIDFSKSLRLRAVRLSGDIELESCDGTLPLLKSPSILTFQHGTLTFDRACSNKGAICSYLNFMKAALFLEELHIMFAGRVESIGPSRSKREYPVLVPGLRRVIVAHNLNPNIARYHKLFLEYVTLPSLDALQFSCEFIDDSLVNFVKRSLPPLTYLAIDCESKLEDAVFECLRLLPTLTEFRYRCPFTSADFFREFTVADRTNLTCPALETLYLYRMRFLGCPTFCTRPLISMLESRAQISESFQTVKDAFERRLLIHADGISVSSSAKTLHHPFADI